MISPTAFEMSDALNLGAIKTVFKYLPRAYQNGKDREARHRMLVAATMAGIGFQSSGAALTHAFGHTIGSIFELHHGMSVGIFIPYVFQFYRNFTDRYLEICDALKIEANTKEERLDGLVEKVRDLFRALNVPMCLKDCGISEADFEEKMKDQVLYSFEDLLARIQPIYFLPRLQQRNGEYYQGDLVDSRAQLWSCRRFVSPLLS